MRCVNSTQTSPVDLGTKTYKATKDLSLIIENFKGKANVIYYNTTIKILSQNTSHGFGILYFSDLTGGMIPMKAVSIEYRFPAAHTF
jgi:hypothetical protein